MFIKKDLRKIPKILEDAVVCEPQHDNHPDKNKNKDKDKESNRRAPKRSKVQAPLSELRLGRRQQEFQGGSIRMLCQPKYLPKLQELKSLNLYDCALSNLDTIGVLGDCPNLQILNLGRNPLTDLPDELSKLGGSLQELWLDDCQLTGALPACLMHLSKLELLRVPHNRITHVPAALATQLTNLKILCLDRNPLEHDHHQQQQQLSNNGPLSAALPDLDTLVNLEQLFLRHTNLIQLPALPTSLRVLHVSSNPSLTELTSATLRVCRQLTHLYANGCGLTGLPEGIVGGPDHHHPHLQRLVVSHNPSLASLPDDVWQVIRASELPAGEEEEGNAVAAAAGAAAGAGLGTAVKILWQPNPQLLTETDDKEAAQVAPPSSDDDDEGDAQMDVAAE